MTDSLQATVDAQAELIRQLSVDPAYNILTRTGLEKLAWPQIADIATFVIFADVDDMHELNDRHGWDDVNRMIEQALHSRSNAQNMTRMPDVGRWFSGDEILWIICEGDPRGLAQSIQTAMHAWGFSATFAIAPVNSPLLFQNVESAMHRVRQAKLAGKRGVILEPVWGLQS